MPFTLIKGTFCVVGLSPDGDSIRFVPDDDALVRALPGGSSNGKPSRQLRLEGIDALETHYNARHQPGRWAFAATEAILAFAGVGNVQWDSRHATVVAADDGTRGWILARHKEKYNRPVAFLFAGEAPDDDGASVMLGEELLRRSFNLQALHEGLAYPTFYASLFADLRTAMTAATVDARTGKRGLWQDDRTTAGFEAASLAVLMDEVPILPKLFRRLSDYMAASGTAIGFKEALAEGQDIVWDLRTQQRTHLDTFVEQASGSVEIRLTRDPEDLVFDEMPLQPPGFFAALVGAPMPSGA